MWKNHSIFLGGLIFLVVSCTDQITVYQDNLSDTITVEDNEALLQESVTFGVAGVIDIFGDASTSNKGSSSAISDEAGDFPLTQVAQIKPPVYNGSVLTSTHVYVTDEYAYISYNTAGETFLGAVDIIRIKNPNKPKLRSRLYYTNADINALVYENGYVYIAGAVDAELSTLATANSFVARIPVYKGKFDLSSDLLYGFQEGNNANDITISGNRVVVTSGREGYLATYDKSTLEKLEEVPYFDLRSVATNGSQYAVLDASEGVSILDNEFQVLGSMPIGAELGADTKKTIDYVGNRIFVPQAYQGAAVYEASSGNLIGGIPIPTNPLVLEPGDKTTNAVGYNHPVILMANGGAGMCLSEEMNDGTFRMVGILELDGSMNHLATKDDYIIAASGNAGVQIIKFNRPSPSLEARCSDLPEYKGQAKLTVRTNESLAYRGSKRFNNINVFGSLLLCGSWTVRNNVIIDERALFEMKGMMAVGRNNRQRNIVVEANGILKVEGQLDVYGDIILNEGSTLEFIGSDNTANVFGSVEIAEGAQVIGSFVDVKQKF